MEFGMKHIFTHFVKSIPSPLAQNFKMYIATHNTPQLLQVNDLEDRGPISLPKLKMELKGEIKPQTINFKNILLTII